MSPELAGRMVHWEDLLQAALRGAHDVLEARGGSGPCVEIVDAVFTCADSTPEAAYIAGFMATADLLGSAARYSAHWTEGGWQLRCDAPASGGGARA